MKKSELKTIVSTLAQRVEILENSNKHYAKAINKHYEREQTYLNTINQLENRAILTTWDTLSSFTTPERTELMTSITIEYEDLVKLIQASRPDLEGQIDEILVWESTANDGKGRAVIYLKQEEMYEEDELEMMNMEFEMNELYGPQED